MIVDKIPLPDDPMPAEAPPSYDSLGGSTANSVATEEKSSSSASPTTPSASKTPFKPAFDNPNRHPKSKPPFKSPFDRHPKSKSIWSKFTSSSRTAKEVRTTVLALVHDVIIRPSPSPSPPDSDSVSPQDNDDESLIAILESCADACATHDISFSSLLQEKSVEGHTPIYWAILKRPTSSSCPSSSSRPSLYSTRTNSNEAPENDKDKDELDLITKLLSMSFPLLEPTISEIKHACLLNNDDVLFQKLKCFEVFAPVGGTDQILLGLTRTGGAGTTDALSDGLGVGIGTKDRIRVVPVSDDDAAFAVHFEVPMFQKRMRVGGRIGLEFIAKGRIFLLSFFIAPEIEGLGSSAYGKKPGTWLVSLELMQHSSPTWVDSRLIIRERETPTPTHSPFSSPVLTPPASQTQSPTAPRPRSRVSSSSLASLTPPTLPFNANASNTSLSSLSPSPGTSSTSTRTNTERPKPKTKTKPKPTINLRLKSPGSTQLIPVTRGPEAPGTKAIVVSLEDSLMGGSLMYEGASYFTPNGTLRAMLEGRLAKPGPECVIC